MACKVTEVILGADVSKDWLDLNCHGVEAVERIDNESAAIDAYLKRYPGAVLAVETTNRYHLLLLERAQRLGMVVYLVSGYQLKHYAHSIRQRMRNDPIDARLIARFLHRERDGLTPWQPRAAEHEALLTLLKRRAVVVRNEQQLRQSMENMGQIEPALKQLFTSYKQLLAALDKEMDALIDQLGWRPHVKRVDQIPGVGRLNAIALVTLYYSGVFVHHDPFIAYLGLDVQTKDSGQMRGKRRLSKRGEGEFRRLLFLAAMAASRTEGYFATRYPTLRARGHASTAAYVIIARKIATVAFNLLRLNVDFDPARLDKPKRSNQAAAAQ